MKNKNQQDLLSSQTSQALLKSTDTFNANQLSKSTESPTYIEQFKNTQIKKTFKRNKYLKPILTCFGFIILIVTIVSFIIIMDLYVNKKHSNYKTQQTNQINTKSDRTLTTKNTNTLNEIEKFQWNHCGQTHAKPSINTKTLRKKRIVGGEDAVKHSWPFLVSVRFVQNKSEHHCGGTLITDQHVLTAAHCILIYTFMLNHYNLNVSQIKNFIEVHVGLNDHENDPTYLTHDHVYGVEYFDWHEKFNYSDYTLVHDIAIIKLNRKVNLNRPEVNVVCLPMINETENSVYKVKKGDNVVAIGWGSYAEEYNYTAYVRDNIQQAVFTIKDENDEICNSGQVGNTWDKNNTVCADGNDKRMSTCYGDSGGPVLIYRNNKWNLFGIISFGHDVRDSNNNKLKKCNASMPFYFVKVNSYANWINYQTNFTLAKFQK